MERDYGEHGVKFAESLVRGTPAQLVGDNGKLKMEVV